MKPLPSARTLGALFIIVASFGLILSISGIAATWFYRPRLQNSIHDFVETVDDTLRTTRDGLLILDSTIDDTIENLRIIETTLDDLDTTIENISASLTSSAELIGNDLQTTIIDTQIALASASTSAGFIDDFLSFFARLPLIGENYQPDIPLSTSLEQVAISLDDFPNALETIETNLVQTTEGINSMNQELSELSSNLSGFEKDLEDAQRLLLEYDEIFVSVLEQTNNLQTNLRSNLMVISLILSVVFIWLGATQVLFLLQGFAYVRGVQQTPQRLEDQ